MPRLRPNYPCRLAGRVAGAVIVHISWSAGRRDARECIGGARKGAGSSTNCPTDDRANGTGFRGTVCGTVHLPGRCATGFEYPGAGTAYCAIAALDVPAARAATSAKTLNLVAIITSLKQDKSSRLSRIKKLECLARWALIKLGKTR